MNEARAYFPWMGTDVEATVTFDVTDWGSPPTRDYVNGGDPGWGPEWDINEIVLREDRPGELGPAFTASGALFQALAWNEKINDAIQDSIAEDAMNRHCRRLRGAAR